MYKPQEALDSAPSLLAVIRELIEATKKNSPGGKKITPEEWLEIGREAGILVAEVARDVVD